MKKVLELKKKKKNKKMVCIGFIIEIYEKQYFIYINFFLDGNK